jgi:hypothetical protein
MTQDSEWVTAAVPVLRRVPTPATLTRNIHPTNTAASLNSRRISTSLHAPIPPPRDREAPYDGVNLDPAR